jgi:hypothetical protein
MAAAASTPEPLQGALLKQSDHLKVWNERTFRVEESRLFYWLSAEACAAHERPRGILRLQGCAVSDRTTPDASDSRLWTFTIVPRGAVSADTDARSSSSSNSELRPYVLACDRRAEAERWRAVIFAASVWGESASAFFVSMSKDSKHSLFTKLCVLTACCHVYSLLSPLYRLVEFCPRRTATRLCARAIGAGRTQRV